MKKKTVMLKRNSNKGFGFVLRGAKAPSPTQEQPSTSKNTTATIHGNADNSTNNNKNKTTGKEIPNKNENTTNLPPISLRPVSLQYFEDIESGGVADLAGLRPGDYLININGKDVRDAIHEYVVNLIRQSGDQVTVTVATPIYQMDDLKDQQSDSKTLANQSSIESRKGSLIVEKVYDLTNRKANLSPSATRNNTINESKIKYSAEAIACNKLTNSSSTNDHLNTIQRKAAPLPPKRDPNTTLSRGRAKSLIGESLDGTNRFFMDDSLPPAPDLTEHKPLTTSTSLEPTIKKDLDQSNNSANNNNLNNNSMNGHDECSSPSSPSVQSIIHNVKSTSTANKKEIDQNKGNKVASIRSRSARRVSAFELEQYFAQQNNNDSKKTNGHSVLCGTLQTPKKANLEKKTFHSTSDIQAELDEENKKDSQQKSHFETLTLKNGRIISNNLENEKEENYQQTTLTKKPQQVQHKDQTLETKKID